MRKLFLVLLVFIAAAFTGSALWMRYGPQSLPETVMPTRGKIVQAVYATGEVEPINWSKVSAQIPGKIQDIYVKEGDKVKQNQTLAQMEDSVECAKASEYLAQLNYLDKEKDRIKNLLDKDFASKSQFEKIVSEYQMTKARLDAQNKVVGRLKITAPIDGIVLERDIDPGESVTPEQIIFWIGEPEKLQVTAEVDEEDIPLVQIGQKVLIKADAFPNHELAGTVNKITPRGDPIDKNFRVRVGLPPDTVLMVGMTVEINIITHEEKNALLVPADSILKGKVWVVHNKKINPHPVQIGIIGEHRTQILDGLTEQDRILAKPPNDRL